ncbi:MAG: S8 family serine peptidase, partial [Actinomycetota bacterium]
PELSAPAGSFAFDLDLNQPIRDAEVSLISCGGRSPDRLLEFDTGTSYAAPLVSRIAAAVATRYPSVGPNLIRALLLQGVDDPMFDTGIFPLPRGKQSEAARKLLGYGAANLGRAIESNDHRVVLVAEAEITVDGVHIYEVPIPASFFESGGTRGVRISLCYDPDVRARRLDYMSSKMDFHLIKGLTAEAVEKVFFSLPEEEVEQAEMAISDDAEGEEADNEGPPVPSQLGRHLIKLDPSPTARSRGANQVAGKEFRQKLKPEDGDHFLVVIRNTNRWASADSAQPYGVAVALSRDVGHPALYSELQVRLEIPVEIEIRG